MQSQVVLCTFSTQSLTGTDTAIHPFPPLLQDSERCTLLCSSPRLLRIETLCSCCATCRMLAHTSGTKRHERLRFHKLFFLFPLIIGLGSVLLFVPHPSFCLCFNACAQRRLHDQLHFCCVCVIMKWTSVFFLPRFPPVVHSFLEYLLFNVWQEEPMPLWFDASPSLVTLLCVAAPPISFCNFYFLLCAKKIRPSKITFSFCGVKKRSFLICRGEI